MGRYSVGYVSAWASGTSPVTPTDPDSNWTNEAIVPGWEGSGDTGDVNPVYAPEGSYWEDSVGSDHFGTWTDHTHIGDTFISGTVIIGIDIVDTGNPYSLSSSMLGDIDSLVINLSDTAGAEFSGAGVFIDGFPITIPGPTFAAITVDSSGNVSTYFMDTTGDATGSDVGTPISDTINAYAAGGGGSDLGNGKLTHTYFTTDVLDQSEIEAIATGWGWTTGGGGPGPEITSWDADFSTGGVFDSPLTVALPTTADGNSRFAFVVVTNSSPPVVTTPTGWDLLIEDTSGNNRVALYHRLQQSGDADTVDFAIDSPGSCIANGMGITVDKPTAPDDISAKYDATGTFTPDSITSADTSQVMAICACSSNGGGYSTATSDWTKLAEGTGGAGVSAALFVKDTTASSGSISGPSIVFAGGAGPAVGSIMVDLLPVEAPSSPSFIGISAAVGDASGHSSLSVPLVPCDVGDWRFISISQVITNTIIPPFDWTLLNNNADSSNQVYSYVYYRQKQIGDDDSNVVFGWGSTVVCAAVSCAFAGVSGLGPSATKTAGMNTGTLASIPSITTGADDSWVVAFAINQNGASTSNWSDPNTTLWTTTDGRANSGPGSYGNFGVFHFVQSVAGAIGTSTMIVDNSGSEPQVVIVELQL